MRCTPAPNRPDLTTPLHQGQGASVRLASNLYNIMYYTTNILVAFYSLQTSLMLTCKLTLACVICCMTCAIYYMRSIQFDSRKVPSHSRICSFLFKVTLFILSLNFQGQHVWAEVLVHFAVTVIRNHPPTILHTPLYITSSLPSHLVSLAIYACIVLQHPHEFGMLQSSFTMGMSGIGRRAFR